MPSKYIASIALLVAGAVIFFSCAKSIQHRNGGPMSSTRIRSTLPFDIARVKETIETVFLIQVPSARSGLPPPFNRFVAGTVPGDFQLSSFSSSNPLLKAYVSTAGQNRKFDVYLYDPLTRFWQSFEYSYGGIPADFNCKFIVHLIPANDSSTVVEILEFQPQIRAGRSFGWSAHSGPIPGFFDNLRTVEPTVTDRQRLLSIVTGLDYRSTR